jgi:hypothetical protein
LDPPSPPVLRGKKRQKRVDSSPVTDNSTTHG